MARTKRCLGVDLGGQSVKVAELAIDGGELRLVRLLSADIPVGPDAQPAERQQAQVAAVREMIKSNKIATKNAVFSIPGQTVFVKRQTLPRATSTQLQRIVQIEARQQIPYPLEKMTLEYQVFDTDNERHVEVLLAAMKRETNQEFMRTFRATGLRVSGISISSLALYNGQELRRYDAREAEKQAAGGGFLGLRGKGKSPAKNKKKKKKKGKKGDAEGAEAVALEEEAASAIEESDMPDMPEDLALAPSGEFEEICAYVNIGARSTDLAIGKSGEPRGVGFVRSIPLGGNHMTQAVFRACECDSFAQAEKIKVERAAVRSADFEFDADPSQYDEKACEVVTAVADRIVAELRRSLDYYISQPDGAAVDSVVLSGGGASTAFLPGYIAERLSMSVEVSSELGNPNVKMPSQYDSDFDFSAYRIALGLASQGLGISTVDVDFLPSDVRGARDLGTQSIELLVLAGMLGGMVFFGSQLGNKSTSYWQNQVSRFESRIKDQRPQTQRLERVKRAHTGVLDRLKSVSGVLDPRDFWLRVTQEVQKAKPPDVLVTNMACEVDPLYPWGGVVRIQAQAERQAKLNDFLRALKALKPYVLADGDAEVDPNAPLLSNIKSPFFTKRVQQMQFYVKVQERGKAQVVRVPPAAAAVAPKGGESRGGEGGFSEGF